LATALLIGIDTLLVLVVALALDAIFGEPEALWRRVPHPVVAIGGVIGWADRSLNRRSLSPVIRRLVGLGFVLALAGGSFLLGRVTEAILLPQPLGWLPLAALASMLIAQRALHDHVAAVAKALQAEGLEGGRRAVAMIVGRDTRRLDEAGVARAAIESCAENHSDGVVAPAFWFALLGLGGLVAYKAVNTADSMIGHRSERHAAFGFGAARLDDALNLLPARLSGVLLAGAAFVLREDGRAALRAMRRDAPRHRSPNAGWPEAAMAGALGLALGGPRVYVEGPVEDVWLHGEGRREATAQDIRRALRLFVTACVLQAALVVMLSFL
jgi:adenosylcobinamide-phosphate synthase